MELGIPKNLRGACEKACEQDVSLSHLEEKGRRASNNLATKYLGRIGQQEGRGAEAPCQSNVTRRMDLTERRPLNCHLSPSLTYVPFRTWAWHGDGEVDYGAGHGDC